MSYGDVAGGALAPVSPGVRRTAGLLGRIGAGSRGALYVLIGAMALLAAGDLHKASGPKETLQSVSVFPGGRVLLLILGCGFAAFAVFHGLDAVLNLRRKRSAMANLGRRFVALCLAVTYGSLTYFTVHLCLYPTSREPHSIRNNVATLLELPTGRMVLVGIVCGIGGFGLLQLYRAVSAHPDSRLAQSRYVVLRAIARVGLGGRGVLFLGIAALLGRVAFDNNPAKAGGIGTTLRTLQSYSAAKPLLLTMGIALVAFGVIDMVAPHPPHARPKEDAR